MPSINDNFFSITVEGDRGRQHTYKVAAVNRLGQRIRLPEGKIEGLTPDLQVMLQGMLHATSTENKACLNQALDAGGIRFGCDRSVYAYTDQSRPSETLSLIDDIVNEYFPSSLVDESEGLRHSPGLGAFGGRSPAFTPIDLQRPFSSASDRSEVFRPVARRRASSALSSRSEDSDEIRAAPLAIDQEDSPPTRYVAIDTFSSPIEVDSPSRSASAVSLEAADAELTAPATPEAPRRRFHTMRLEREDAQASRAAPKKAWYNPRNLFSRKRKAAHKETSFADILSRTEQEEREAQKAAALELVHTQEEHRDPLDPDGLL